MKGIWVRKCCFSCVPFCLKFFVPLKRCVMWQPIAENVQRMCVALLNWQVYFQYWVTRGQTKTPHFWRLEFFSTGVVLKKFLASFLKTNLNIFLSCYRWHNVLARRIKSRYPNWSDESVFQASHIKQTCVLPIFQSELDLAEKTITDLLLSKSRFFSISNRLKYNLFFTQIL